METDNNTQEQVIRGDVELSKIADTLPDGRAELFACSVSAANQINTSVLAGDKTALIDSGALYRAVIWKLNGGTSFGCLDGDGSPGKQVQKHCSAEPGEVPHWGQSGQFVIEVNGIRALVDYENWMSGMDTGHFQFHALDLDKPFISNTGYRSHYSNLAANCGRTVEAAAIDAFQSRVKEKHGLAAVSDEYLKWCKDKDLPDWCYRLVPAPCREINAVPEGFVLVECILPEYRAATAQQWAAAAKLKLREAKPVKEIPVKARREAFENQPVEHVSSAAKSKYVPGQKCRVIRATSVTQYCSEKLGKTVVIAKVLQSGTTVWAYDDLPARYRINIRGNRTCDFDPRCIQDLYDISDLEILEGERYEHATLLS